jgi:hypothetical protein
MVQKRAGLPVDIDAVLLATTLELGDVQWVGRGLCLSICQCKSLLYRPTPQVNGCHGVFTILPQLTQQVIQGQPCKSPLIRPLRNDKIICCNEATKMQTFLMVD